MQTVHRQPLAETLEALRSGRLRLREHVDVLGGRIDALEPQILALLPEGDRRSRLLREADELETRYPIPDARPPLYGAVVGVKDIFRADGFPTRAGSTLPPDLFAGPEASAVTRLRQAGALVLGKTVTTEFAYFEPGPTGNPHALEHTPGGSSSGSAAAVAAGFCPLALGSQTVGSVIRPAAFCGVVGFKPTYGRIPVDGVIPYSPSVDHVGLFTQDVEGMTLTAAVLCDGWEPAPYRERPVLGIPEGPFLEQASQEALAALEEWLEQLQRAGYTVRRIPVLTEIAAVNARHTALIAAEMAQVHASWFAEHEERYRPRTAAMIRRGWEVSASELEAGLRSRGQLRQALEQQMVEHGIDLWLSPAATGPAPAGLASTGDPAMNLPWTHAGMPALSLPAGRAASGLPLGLQVSARAGQDAALLGWAVGIRSALSGPM